MPLASLLVVGLLAAAPKMSVSHQALRDQCLVWAADPKNPWAMAHGITGLGASFLANDGRRADQVMVHDFLLRASVGDAGVASLYGFARYTADKTPVEPHTNLITKTLVKAGVPMSTRYTTSWGGTVSLAQLVDTAKQRYRHVPSSEAYWKDVGWTLDVLAFTTKPGESIATDAGPVPIDLVMNDALTALEAATAEINAGMAKGLPQVDKRKQGIYAHPCGGLHFVQSVLGWASHPVVRRRWGPRVEQQIDILMYRLGSEARQYDAARQQLPQYKLELLTQQVKFYGHFLETTARLKSDLGWKPNETQTKHIATAKAYLDATVRELLELKTFEAASMTALKTSKPQVYLDLIGDACHATHGLDGWK